MRRFTIFLAAVLGFCAALYSSIPDRATPSVQAHVRIQDPRAGMIDPTVKILRSTGGGGTGVIVGHKNGKSQIVTAFHVVSGETTFALIRMVNGKKEEAIAKLVRWDLPHDLAMLESDEDFGGAAATVINPDKAQLDLFMPIYVYGYAFIRRLPTLTEGVLQDPEDDLGFRVSAMMVYGNSGGGIYIRQNGRYVLVSICQRMMTAQGAPVCHMGFGCRPKDLVAFLSRKD